MTDSDFTDPILEITARLEAMLFVAPGAVAVGQLAEALELPQAEVEAGLLALEEACLLYTSPSPRD